MDAQAKTPRKRVANFTADEKALLAQLVKNKPLIESKLTDGRSIAKKQAAWELLTREFNCHANVTKRETNTLKRAWDNMKAWTRKTRAIERGNLIRTGGGPQQTPTSPQQGAIISMVEDAAPVMICEISNTLDSDGIILSAMDCEDVDLLEDVNQQTSQKVIFDIVTEENKIDGVLDIPDNTDKNSPQIGDMPIKTEQAKSTKHHNSLYNQDQGRRPTDYIRREAVLRIKYLENKQKVEMQILKTKLESEEMKKEAVLLDIEHSKSILEQDEIKKETALLDKEHSKLLLEQAKIKKEAALLDIEHSKLILEQAKIRLSKKPE